MQPLTDEERQKLVKQLRNIFTVSDMWTMCDHAAEEIERLASNHKDEYGPPLTETEQLVNVLRYSDPMYVGINVRRQAADEIERLAEEVRKLTDELELAKQPDGMFYD